MAFSGPALNYHTDRDAARKLGFPVRFIEDRLENMSGGDAHGPDRIPSPPAPCPASIAPAAISPARRRAEISEQIANTWS